MKEKTLSLNICGAYTLTVKHYIQVRHNATPFCSYKLGLYIQVLGIFSCINYALTQDYLHKSPPIAAGVGNSETVVTWGYRCKQ
jgi:hypothetical protein